jgi:hypothetical protein
VETKEWQDKVDSLRANYEAAVKQEATLISDRQKSELRSFAKDIIQLSTGALGLITGMVALLIGAMRGKIPTVTQSRDTDFGVQNS